MNVLSAEERQKIREGEILKTEVRHELQTATPGQSAIAGFFGHQAVLLIVGFILTTGTGSWLTYYWKQRESKNQQNYIAKRHVLEKKYELIDQTLRSISETNTAAEDILTNYSYGKWSARDIEERKKNWMSTSRNWRISSKVLRQKLEVYFDNRAVSSTLEQVIDKRHLLGVSISRILSRSIKSKKEADAEIAQDQALVNEIKQMLTDLGRLMAKEVKP